MANLTEYSNDQIAHALATLEAYGGNANMVARLLNIPRTTLRQWAGRAKSETAYPKQLGADDRLADKFEAVADKALDSAVAEEKLAKAGFRDLLVGADIANRSARLLRGQSTSNNVSLRIELVAGNSLRELAERTMTVQTEAPKAIPPRT